MNKQDPDFQSHDDSNKKEYIRSLETKEPRTTKNDRVDEGEESATAREWREMREEKSNASQDVSLESPQDANTEKHVNFLDTDSERSVAADSSDETESPTQREWREMREEKNKNTQDISLQTPQDANTEKHINFLDDES